ncbi:MAG: Fe-S-containing protein [Chloroflexota bacterium]
MPKRILSGIVLLLALGLITLVACSGGTSAPQKAGWVESKINGDTVSIPASKVQNSKIVDFGVSTSAGDMTFMAYWLGGKTYVRASICPPCRSRSFALKGDKLVCDACGTVFSATTGKGISGACVAYPKAEVAYGVNGGDIVMKADALTTAYADTLNPG